MFVPSNWVTGDTIYSGGEDWQTNEYVGKQELCCRRYYFEMHDRHPNGAAKEEMEFRGKVLLGYLEVINIQMALKGMDQIGTVGSKGSRLLE